MNLLMKRSKLISILGILAILLALNPISAFAAEPMEDIAGHWAEEQIQGFVDNGYIKGYPDGTFKPENNITRAEFITIANNAFGYTEKAEIDYSDVADGSWYKDAISVAKAAGYIAGYPDGAMRPDAPITRQEAAVIVAKINDLEADAAATDIFKDSGSIPAWSKGSIGTCMTAKILTGYPDGSFLGKNFIKRGESTVTLSKALDYKNTIVVAKTVTDISVEGFQLNLTPAVDGLTQSAVTLTKNDSAATGAAINTNVTVTAITTENSGAAYTIAAGLEEGQTYKLNLAKEGYDFGSEVTLTVATDQQAEDQAAADQAAADQAAADAVTAKIAALPAAAELTLENKAAVTEAEAGYIALTEAQKELISSENKTKLSEAIAKIAILETTEAETGTETGQE